MASPGGREGPEELHLYAAEPVQLVLIDESFCHETLGSPHRAHCVGGGRTHSYAEQVKETDRHQTRIRVGSIWVPGSIVEGMSNQEVWESRYRDEENHTPDGVVAHPIVIEHAEAVAARARDAGVDVSRYRAADLGSGAGRHTLALAELGMSVTAVDFAASAHDLMHQAAVQRSVAERCTPVVADVSSWQPADTAGFDVIVAAYLHSELAVLSRSADHLAPGGRLVWVGHAPNSPHGPPPEIHRDDLAAHRREVEPLEAEGWRVLRLDEYQLSAEFLDIIAVIEKPLSSA